MAVQLITKALVAAIDGIDECSEQMQNGKQQKHQRMSFEIHQLPKHQLSCSVHRNPNTFIIK